MKKTVSVMLLATDFGAVVTPGFAGVMGFANTGEGSSAVLYFRGVGSDGVTVTVPRQRVVSPGLLEENVNGSVYIEVAATPSSHWYRYQPANKNLNGLALGCMEGPRNCVWLPLP